MRASSSSSSSSSPPPLLFSHQPGQSTAPSSPELLPFLAPLMAGEIVCLSLIIFKILQSLLTGLTGHTLLHCEKQNYHQVALLL